VSDDKTIDYYFSITSPWSYLGHDRFMALAKGAGLRVRFHPVDFGAVFAVSGGLPLPKRAPQRQRYRLFELERWRRRLGVPLTIHPKHFPTDAAPGARAIVAASEMGLDAGALTGALMRACWVEDRNVAEPETIRAAADALSMDGAALLARSEAPEIRAKTEAETEAAKEAQVFGAPSWIYRGELFWGQDRIDFLEELVRGRREPVGVTFP
jgi:2-hydroxychromene-2-carboxylate isomerase